MDTDIAIVHNILEIDIGPVTWDDYARHYEMGLPWNFFEKENDVDDEDGYRVGFETTCREVYYAMRVRYMRRQLDKIGCNKDNKFLINYNFE